MEKPVATDALGIRQVLATTERETPWSSDHETELDRARRGLHQYPDVA